MRTVLPSLGGFHRLREPREPQWVTLNSREHGALHHPFSREILWQILGVVPPTVIPCLIFPFLFPTKEAKKKEDYFPILPSTWG